MIKSAYIVDDDYAVRDSLTILLETHGFKVSVIMMSGHADVAMAVRALKHGAADFIEKPFASADILAAIDRVLPTVEVALSQGKEQSENLNKLAKLTKRETQVMALLVEGKPNKIVAADLGLSVRTVETHRAHILSKLGVKSLSDLVRLSMLMT